MNSRQYFKNKKKVIEAYLEDPTNPIKAHQLVKPRKTPLFHEKPDYLYSTLIRKDLQCTKDNLYNESQPMIHHNTYSTGLYHNRNDDYYDWNHIDCVEDGFCLHHNRQNDNFNKYKHHYHCRYGMSSSVPKDKKKVHGEKKWFSNKFVCFDCRNVTSRSSSEKSIRNYSSLEKWPKCSTCQKYMTSVSVAFQPPPKRDVKHWERLKKEWYEDSRITYDEYNRCQQT